MRLFLDSGAFIARFNEEDAYHKTAVETFKSIAKGDLPYKRFYTSNYVLDEAVTFILYQTKSHRDAVEMLDLITKSKHIHLLFVDEEIQRLTNELFRKYKDQLISLTDCFSAVLMKEFGIETIFTFDQDFSTLGVKIIP